MLIDWFTVGAQALNFLVLVWLMKRFLYQPVLKAIDAREQHIAQTLATATEQQASAQQEREAFQQRNADFDQQRASQLAKVQADMAAERSHLLADTRQAAEALRTQQHRALASELQHLHQHIAQRTQQEAFALANQTLSELADTTLQAQMVAVFARRLTELDEPARQALTQALGHAANPTTSATALATAPATTVQVRSAFALTPAEQDHIRAALGQALDPALGGGSGGAATAGATLVFSTAPEVMGGLELTTNGWKLAWHLADHVAALRQRVQALATQVVATDADAEQPTASVTATAVAP